MKGHQITGVFFVYCACLLTSINGCQFYPSGEYLRFVRVPESLPVGGQVLSIEVHPRRNLMLQPLEREEDASFFTWRDQNRTHVSVILAHSLEDLVDSDTPQNVLKFRIGCEFADGDDMISAFLSVTVYVEDVNDHSPEFTDAPYHLTVDELTPVGLTIFRGISAVDRDKPDTPNSDVQYSLSGGAGRFALEGSRRPALLLSRALDYDTGDRTFTLLVTATDRGSPPRSTNTSVTVIVQDNDDLGPRFTRDVYRSNITESYPLTSARIHRELGFHPPIAASDQDRGLDAPLRYDIVSGNERQLFALDSTNGSLFLTKEIDLDAEKNLHANTFALQIQASQIDNPLKTAIARIEIEVLDLNDNLPEFEVDFYNISIVENLPNGFSVLQVMATDKDQGENGEFLYQLQDPHGAFSIDPRSGWLTVRDQSVLDREQHSSLKMKVYAKEKKESVVSLSQHRRILKSKRHSRSSTLSRDRFSKKTDISSPNEKTTYVFPDTTALGDHTLTPNLSNSMSFVNVEVTLLDANDNNPVFLPSNLYEFSVKSSAKVGDLIGRVRAVDPDLGRNGMVLYDLQRSSNLTVTSPFMLEPQTGALRVAESPLPEGRHALFLEASDQPANPSERRFSLAVVSVEVTHGAKGPKATVPDFVGAPYEFWVGANVGVGTSIGQIRLNDAMDKDNIAYDLLHSYHEGVPFAVEERSGTITVVDDPARFGRPIYDFEAVVSRTSGTPIISNGLPNLVTNVTIHVVDPEDERGVLMKGSSNSPIEFHVKENLAGAIIGQLLYQNHSNFFPNKSTKSVRFIIANQQDVTDDIAIGQDGTLYTQKALDREKRDAYRLTVIAEYTKGAVSGAGIYQVTIIVDDENDNAPIFSRNSYEGSIEENSAANTEVNMTNLVIAHDADIGNNSITNYKIFGDGHSLFEVNKTSGRVYFKGSKLDREEKTTYRLRLVATDNGNLSSETKLTIHVTDVNDNPPIIKRIIIPSDEQIEVLEYDDRSLIKVFEEKHYTSGIRFEVVKPRSKPLDLLSTEVSPLIEVPETISVGTTILRLEAEDQDIGENGMIRFVNYAESLSSTLGNLPSKSNSKQYFIVNEQTGEVTVSKVLPPEYEFKLNITAQDGGGLQDSVNIRIFVKDINDHAPMFKKSWYNFDVEEAIYSRKVLGKLEATDSDYGKNSNVSYYIVSKERNLPFEISTLNGILSVNGELDREIQEYYKFSVVAKDNGLDVKMSSTVTVEVQVLDINDNAPKFYGHDELLEWAHPEAKDLPNHNYESVLMIPVYYAKLSENSPIGSMVAKVYANDSDFPGNGNGLLIFDIPRRKNFPNLFTIDSKEGIVTTTGKLDYETQLLHNITVIASDLGSPSLSSTALIILKVSDIPDDINKSEEPIFIDRYYEVEIDENANTPLELLTLNVSEYYRDKKLRFSIISGDKSDVKRMFVVDPRNGTLYLVRSPDRETRDEYEIVVRAEKPKHGRNLPHMIYPVPEEDLEGLTKFDVKVVVKINDVNDNAPRFTIFGRPIVAAIPTTASFGYEIVKVQAVDPDLGENGAVRYQLLSEHAQRFSVDPITGQLRTAALFTGEAGRVFGFDVKATDRAGADDGKSAIANVFVYVLDATRQVVVSLSGAALQVQRAEPNITSLLSSATGLDVRVRHLEPRPGDSLRTNMYVYGVDPVTNSLVDMDTLQRSLLTHQSSLELSLGPELIVERAGLAPRPAPRAPLRPLQLGVLLLGAALVMAALATALCIVCFKRNKRNRHKAFSQHRLSALGLSAGHLIKGAGLFPAQDASRLYRDADPPASCRHGRSVDQFGQAHQQCVRGQLSLPRPPAPLTASRPPAHNTAPRPHEPSCVRFNRRPTGSKRKGGIETSITSVHSSGQDSGIADGPCACHSTSQSEEESSNGSYEDSLKSSHATRRSLKVPSHTPTSVPLPTSLHASILRRHPKRRPRKAAPPLKEPVVDYDQSEVDEEDICRGSALLRLARPGASGRL